nr:uncharacterized protein LOC126054753 [Helicoverpa armigera]
MTQLGGVVTLGELLDEHAEAEEENVILERVKVLAQEHLPDGWTNWEVTTATKEEVFGEKVDPNILNKLVVALPTVGLVRAFIPEADHLSEKRYREIRHKILDWAFTRALIIGPPAISNRIRGSAARTEYVKQSVAALMPLLHTRAETDKILSGCLSETEETSRKRRSTSRVKEPATRRPRLESPPFSTGTSLQEERFCALEQKMEMLLEMVTQSRGRNKDSDSDSDKENDFSDGEEEVSSDASDAPSWKAPTWGPYPNEQDERNEKELEFRPTTKEADPLVPEPSSQAKKEGIECQRLGTDSWNRIRYKDVEKHLHAASPFSPLKVNTEVGTLASRLSPWVTRQEGILGTITHGLLLQRKALADGLNATIKKCPDISTDLRRLVEAEDSKFKLVSDQLLQYVCANRAETIEVRRKTFRPKNDVLTSALNNIPPSPTLLFDEKLFSAFIKDNGGTSGIFASSNLNKKETIHSFRKNSFRKASSHASKSKQPTGRGHSSAATTTTSTRSANYRRSGNSKGQRK